MTEKSEKLPGRLARAVATARIAVAVVSPLANSAMPVPTNTVPDVGAQAQSQRVEQDTTKQLADAQGAEARERRRQGLELGYQLKQPDTAQVDPSTKAPRRGGRR